MLHTDQLVGHFAPSTDLLLLSSTCVGISKAKVTYFSSVHIGLQSFMVVGLIGVNALMAIKLGIVTALLQQMEGYPVLVQTEDCAQRKLLKHWIVRAVHVSSYIQALFG